MRITNLSIDGFGLFNGRFELNLSDTVSLIVGDNETGKSTLVRAMTAIVFGLGTESEKAALAPYGMTKPGSGSLEIESDTKKYRFTRDYSSNHVTVETIGADGGPVFDGSAKPGGRTDEKEAYDILVREVVGVENQDMFQNSAFVEQNSIETDMDSVVRRIASGSPSADYVIVHSRLRGIGNELSMELPWMPGKAKKPRRIEILQAEIQDKKEKLAGARRAGTAIDELNTRLETAESQLADASGNLKVLREREKALTAFLHAADEKKRLEAQVNECRNEIRETERLTDELKRNKDVTEKEYAEYASISEQAETDMAALAQLRANEDELRKKYEREEKEIVPILRLVDARFSGILIIIGLLVAGLGGTHLEGILKVFAILAGIAVAAWPLISLFVSLRSHESERRGKLEEIKEQLDLVKARASEMQQRYPMLGEKEPNSILDGLRKYRALQSERGKKEEALKQHPPKEEVESKYNALCNELMLSNKKLEDLKSQNPSLGDLERQQRVGASLEEAKTEIAVLEKKLEKLTHERENLKLDLARAEASETISEEALEEEIAEMEEELERLTLHRDACLLAHKTLEEAISTFHSSHLERIQQKTSDYLSRIAGNNYRVSLDEKLEPIAVEQETRTFQLSQLSQGVRDQLYFALRLAAAEEISGNARLPLLLDDPFVNFDEKRLKATLQMLETISEAHQVILFTHDRRYRDWREPSCVLER